MNQLLTVKQTMGLTKDDVREIVEASEDRIRADINGEFKKLRHELRPNPNRGTTP